MSDRSTRELCIRLIPLLVVALLLLLYTVSFLFALSAPHRLSPPPATHSAR